MTRVQSFLYQNKTSEIMSNLILILGPSGSGKSTAIRTLPPENTLIINVLGKRLPFKGSAKKYVDNLFVPTAKDIYGSTISRLNAANQDEKLKYVVIDDATYFMRYENFATCTQSGYTRFTSMAKNFQTLLLTCQRMRDDITTFFVMHSEEVVSDGKIISYQPATCGTLIKREYNPQECVTVALYATPMYNENKAQYVFITNRAVINGVEIPAKSPADMFGTLIIENDYLQVAKKIQEYYE